jgi:hypothetical protein
MTSREGASMLSEKEINLVLGKDLIETKKKEELSFRDWLILPPHRRKAPSRRSDKMGLSDALSGPNRWDEHFSIYTLLPRTNKFCHFGSKSIDREKAKRLTG